MLSPKQPGEENTGSVEGKESTNAVEFRCKNLEDYLYRWIDVVGADFIDRRRRVEVDLPMQRRTAPGQFSYMRLQRFFVPHVSQLVRLQ